MKRIGAIASLAVLAGGCNGTEDPVPTTCTNDWDCAVGQVCSSATNTCVAAGAGAERNFGQVEMTFVDGSEAYLLAVYDLPTDAESSSNLLSFALSAGGAPAGALRIEPATRQPTYDLDRSAWAARIEFESRRHQSVRELVAGIRAGDRSVLSARPRQAGGDCTTSSECTDGVNDLCWAGTCTSEPSLRARCGDFFDDAGDQAQCIATNGCTWSGGACTGIASIPFSSVYVTTQGIEISVLIDNADTAGDAVSAAQSVADAVASSLEDVLDLYGISGGHADALDRDGDGRMTIAFSNKLASVGDTGIVGGFLFADYLATSDGAASGNEADVLWALVPSTDTLADCQSSGNCSGVTTQESSIGTLVHEYTHLIQFATRVFAAGATPDDNEVVWLDEAMAHLMEDMAGYGASNVGIAAVALDEWPSFGLATGEDSVEQRGRGYMLLRYIVDTASGAADAAAANSFGLHEILINETELGFRHSPFVDLGPDGVWDWLLATYATNNPDVTEAGVPARPYLPTAIAASGQTTGFDPFGGFVDARGVDIDLTGPILGDGSDDEITDHTDPFESELQASGAVYYIVTGLEAGTQVLTGRAGAQDNLFLRAQRVY